MKQELTNRLPHAMYSTQQLVKLLPIPEAFYLTNLARGRERSLLTLEPKLEFYSIKFSTMMLTLTIAICYPWLIPITQDYVILQKLFALNLPIDYRKN